MVLNATFNNISAISWRSVLLVGETGVHVASHWQTSSHNVVSSTPHLSGFEITTLVMIGTDCIGSHKSSYLTITTTTAPMQHEQNINLENAETADCVVFVFFILQLETVRHIWQG